MKITTPTSQGNRRLGCSGPGLETQSFAQMKLENSTAWNKWKGYKIGIPLFISIEFYDIFGLFSFFLRIVEMGSNLSVPGSDTKWSRAPKPPRSFLQWSEKLSLQVHQPKAGKNVFFKWNIIWILKFLFLHIASLESIKSSKMQLSPKFDAKAE